MKETEVDTLNSLLMGELSAVESYDKALEKVQDSRTVSILEQCRDSHRERVGKLRDAIMKSGGKPADSTSAWGRMAAVFTSSVGGLGDTAILSALEEGEDVGLNDYEWKLVSMHGENRKLVKEELFPKQQATRKLMSKVLGGKLGGTWPPSPDMSES